MANDLKYYFDGKKMGIKQAADLITAVKEATKNEFVKGVLFDVLVQLQTQLNDVRRIK